MASPPLVITLFGPLRVTVRGEPLPRVRTRSVEWLLALLALRHGRAVSRSWLAGTLWPESDESRALQNLRDDLVRLRKALGPEAERIQAPTRDQLTLDLAGAEVDLLQFDTAVQVGEEASLRAAVVAYTGPLLEGCVEEWVLAERETRAEQCLTALESLAASAEERGDHPEAIGYLRRAERIDPLRDSTQRRLMRVLAAAGDVPAALLTYREHRARLHREMNVEPDEETTVLHRRIRQQTREKAATGLGSRRAWRGSDSGGMGDPALRAWGDGAKEPDNASRPVALSPRRPVAERSEGSAATLARLPHPMTALIGREEEVRQITEDMRRARLVTLVGGGGVGKTRLAIQVAAELADDLAAEAAFVSLASLAEAALLPAFVASALGMREEGEEESLLYALIGRLGSHSTLLVLDNCEHLIDAAAQLAQSLLSSCPHLRILATSRQRLGLTGEIVWRVPSLPVPDPEWQPSDRSPVEAVTRYPAVQLFVERAQWVRPEFRLVRREDALAVAAICRRLDGIPLAIELAAARMSILTAGQIAARLDDRFRLLTGGSRAALPRQQTLRALIDWSYDLLTEPERMLLCALSVFSGAWTLEAAETVCGDFGVRELAPALLPTGEAGAIAVSRTDPSGGFSPPHSKVGPADVLDLLDSLTDRSLVLAEEREAGLRYRMLETVREYAGEKLRERGEEVAARSRHMAYFLTLAEAAAPELHGTDPDRALLVLEVEMDNIRAALAWSQTTAAPPDASLRLTAALWPFWEMRGYHTEGREHLRSALNRPDLPDAPQRAQILLGAATLAFVQVELEEAHAFGQESLERFRALGDPRGTAAALLLLGHVSLERGDGAAAGALLADALEQCRESGWPRGSALACVHLGMVAMKQRDPHRARSLLEQGLSLAETVGDAPTVALSLHDLGYLALETGDYSRAGSFLEQSLVIWRRLGHRHKISLTLRCLGQLARQQGDLARAVSHLEETVKTCREQGNRTHLGVALHELGSVFYEQGAYERARLSYEESLDLLTQVDCGWGIDCARVNLGSTLFHLGDPARARELYREAMGIYQRNENAEGITWSLERLGVVEAVIGDAGQAARVLGAASAAREALGIPMARWDQADWDQSVASLRARLEPDACDAAWAEGRALTREQAIEAALS